MNKKGPIIVIEDDCDDREMLKEVFEKLAYPNPVIFFENGQDALEYLGAPHELPFLILSDINLPKLNGFDLRKKIKEDAALQLKCIPYLFLTTALNQQMVIDAYSVSAQGFFVKDNSIAGLQETIGNIMRYWMKCAAPNNF